MITSKSLHHSNVAFIFDPKSFYPPDNSEFGALYSGNPAQGARFIDDPVIHSKVLTLPAIRLKIIMEGPRFRVEDESQEEPEKSILIHEALAIYHKLFAKAPLTGFGFNFDIYFRFNNVIPARAIFEDFFGEEPLKKQDLRTLGIQFTLEKPKEKIFDAWFLKITAPLELAVHLNRHFDSALLPAEEKMKNLFEKCYSESEEFIKNLGY